MNDFIVCGSRHHILVHGPLRSRLALVTSTYFFRIPVAVLHKTRAWIQSLLAMAIWSLRRCVQLEPMVQTY
jgi:hypothetical protein